jgi:hypothetical protein
MMSIAESDPKQNPIERDFEIYKILLQRWADENPIKTNKLQVLLAVNGLLVSALSVSNGFTADKWYVFLTGAVFSLVWTFSIGRTALFQSVWKIKLDELRRRHPDDERFTIMMTDEPMKKTRLLLRFLGGIPSKWYLIFAPLGFAIVWMVVLLYAILR